MAGRREIKLILRGGGVSTYLCTIRYVWIDGVLHIFGYVTFYFGYCIGYYIDVLLFVARTPDPKHTTAL